MKKISKPSKLWQLALIALACKCSNLKSIICGIVRLGRNINGS